MKTIYLDSEDVPAVLKGAYAGKKFACTITESFSIPADAGLWEGGSRKTYSFVELSSGRTVMSPAQEGAPWDPARKEFSAPLPAGLVLRVHWIFCGKDAGLHFYVHPANAGKFLPASSAELSATGKLVLETTRSHKASYQGLDRYEQLVRYAYGQARENLPARAQWEAARTELIKAGYLNKAGALTTKGRNAIA